MNHATRSKAVRVIASCTTVAQLDTAIIYARLAGMSAKHVNDLAQLKLTSLTL